MMQFLIEIIFNNKRGERTPLHKETAKFVGKLPLCNLYCNTLNPLRIDTSFLTMSNAMLWLSLLKIHYIKALDGKS